MIRKLQHRFIGITIVALLIVMGVILILINALNYRTADVQINAVLAYISGNNGDLPDVLEEAHISSKNKTGTASRSDSTESSEQSSSAQSQESFSAAESQSADSTSPANSQSQSSASSSDSGQNSAPDKDQKENFADQLNDFYNVVVGILQSDYNIRLNKDTILQLRFFTVWTDEAGQVTNMNMQYIAEVRPREAASYAATALSSGQDKGSIADSEAVYNYQITHTKNGEMTVFLDTTSYHDSARQVLYISLLIAFICLILFICIVLFLSGRAIRPMVRNLENQKQFITNAGHELKTPIAIISANAELLEMMNGKNEWTDSIQHQTKRLTGLVNDLITLSKMGEQRDIVKSNIDFSAIARDAAESFRPVAEQEKKSLHVDIPEDIHIMAEEKIIHELVNILVDNAVKYCDDEGRIVVSLATRGRNGARLQVSNTYADGAGVDYDRFFERFYREDTSHNSKKAGYGIGLSMAKEIVAQFKGSIGASYKDGMITFTVQL